MAVVVEKTLTAFNGLYYGERVGGKDLVVPNVVLGLLFLIVILLNRQVKD